MSYMICHNLRLPKEQLPEIAQVVRKHIGSCEFMVPRERTAFLQIKDVVNPDCLTMLQVLGWDTEETENFIYVLSSTEIDSRLNVDRGLIALLHEFCPIGFSGVYFDTIHGIVHTYVYPKSGSIVVGPVTRMKEL
jgi:hypothetical protein